MPFIERLFNHNLTLLHAKSTTLCQISGVSNQCCITTRCFHDLFVLAKYLKIYDAAHGMLIADLAYLLIHAVNRLAIFRRSMRVKFDACQPIEAHLVVRSFRRCLNCTAKTPRFDTNSSHRSRAASRQRLSSLVMVNGEGCPRIRQLRKYYADAVFPCDSPQQRTRLSSSHGEVQLNIGR